MINDTIRQKPDPGPNTLHTASTQTQQVIATEAPGDYKGAAPVGHDLRSSISYTSRKRRARLLSAFSKMPGEHNPGRRRSEQDRALLEGDSEEQRQGHLDVIARYEEAHGVHYNLGALAEKARQRLREVGRSD